MPILMPRKREENTGFKKSEVFQNQPLSSEQAQTERSGYTSAKPTSTNIMRSILKQAKDNPNAIAASKNRVEQKAAQNLANKSNQMSATAQNIQSDINRESQRLKNFAPTENQQIRAEFENSQGASVPTFERLQAMRTMEPEDFNFSTSMDPFDIKAASYLNPDGMYSKGMSVLDDLAFRQSGGESFITDQINKGGLNLENQRKNLGQQIQLARDEYNRILGQRKGESKALVDKLVDELRAKNTVPPPVSPIPGIADRIDEQPSAANISQYGAPPPLRDIPIPPSATKPEDAPKVLKDQFKKSANTVVNTLKKPFKAVSSIFKRK